MHSGIFTLVQRDTILELLSTLHSCTELPIHLVDPQGATIESFGEPVAYCNRMRQHVYTNSVCRNEYKRATQQAKVLGEAYINTCRGNLSHITYTFSKNDTLLGAVIAGPFLMDKPDSTLLSTLSTEKLLSPAIYLDLYDDMTALKIVAPERVTPLGRLMMYLFSPLIPQEKQAYAANRKTLYQQARISEAIQALKQEEAPSEASHLFEQEKQLVAMVSKGDVTSAKAILNELLGYVFFYEGGNNETIKNRALELCTLLSRVAIEKGGHTNQILKLNDQFISDINQAATQESICLLMQNIVEAFIDNVFNYQTAMINQTISKALRYIRQNYTKPLSVKEIALHIGLSPNYFSTLFYKVVGMPFPEYLNRMRIEESKCLLSATDFPIVDIAMAMGYSDQSYFSKTFKRYTGISPREYR